MSKRILFIFFALFVLAHNEEIHSEEINETEPGAAYNMTNETEINDLMHNSHENDVNDEDDKEQFELHAKKLMDEMIGNSTQIPREKFRVFLTNLITRGEKLDANEEEFYKEMVEKIVSKVPDFLDSKEITKYIDQNYLSEILNEVIREKYGDEALQDFAQGDNNQDIPEDNEHTEQHHDL